MAQAGKVNASVLIGALRSTEPEIRASGARAARYVKADDGLTEALVGRVCAIGKPGTSDERPRVRKAAAESLVALGAQLDIDRLQRLLLTDFDQGVTPSLAKLAGRNPDERMPSILARALRRFLKMRFGEPVTVLELVAQIKSRGETSAAVREALIEALAYPDAKVKDAALGALDELAVAGSTRRLMEVFLDSEDDERVQERILRCLVKLHAATLEAGDRKTADDMMKSFVETVRGQDVSNMPWDIRWHIYFIVQYDWGSTKALCQAFPQIRNPDTLRRMAELLYTGGRIPLLVQQRTRACIERLTAGEIRATDAAMTGTQIEDALRRPWKWQAEQAVFVQAPAAGAGNPGP